MPGRIASWVLLATSAIGAVVVAAVLGHHWWCGADRLAEGSLVFEVVLLGGITAPWISLFLLAAVLRVRRKVRWPHLVASLVSVPLAALCLILAAWIDFGIAFGMDGIPSGGTDAALFYGVWAGVLSPAALLIGAVALLAASAVHRRALGAKAAPEEKVQVIE